MPPTGFFNGADDRGCGNDPKNGPFSAPSENAAEATQLHPNQFPQAIQKTGREAPNSEFALVTSSELKALEARRNPWWTCFTRDFFPLADASPIPNIATSGQPRMLRCGQSQASCHMATGRVYKGFPIACCTAQQIGSAWHPFPVRNFGRSVHATE